MEVDETILEELLSTNSASRKVTDDLDGLNMWDFAVMKSEFGDLNSYDSDTLMDIYSLQGISHHYQHQHQHQQLQEESLQLLDWQLLQQQQQQQQQQEEERHRCSSGYSSESEVEFSVNRCCYSPSSSGSLSPAYCQLQQQQQQQQQQQPQQQQQQGQAKRRQQRAKAKKQRKQLQLWEFLYQLLTTESTDALCWEHETAGVFRIAHPARLAELWGRHRSRVNMTYEKMSRTLRYYYEKRVITKVTGRQHTYQFHFDRFPTS